MRLTVKERIFLHLVDFTRYSDAVEVPPGMTQEGVAQMCAIDVRHLTQYIRPLIRGGFVRERGAHVQGGRQRRKVYDLTDAGKMTAVRLRERVKAETVRIRDSKGVRETTLAAALEESAGRATLASLARQMLDTGVIDFAALTPPSETRFAEMLSDAPRIERFVGRRRELEIVTAESDRPRIFVVCGVAGIGKSSFAAKACELLRGARNLYWHRFRPWDSPESILAGLGDFLSALGRPGLRSVLARGQTGRATEVLRHDLPGTLSFLVFDDAHEANREALSFLRFLKDAIAEALDVRALILTRRSLALYDRRDVVLRGLVGEIDLVGLEPRDVAAFLSESRDTALLGLGGRLGGHPLFLEMLRSAGHPVLASHALKDIRRFIEEEIYTGLSDAERRMMKIACLYRVPVPAESLFRDSELSHEVLLALREKSLLMPVGDEDVGVHDTIRDFIATIMTPSERRALGTEVAAELRQLAERAQAKGDFIGSINFLSSALAVTPSPVEGAEVREGLGDAHQRIGDLPGALTLYKEALKPTTETEVLARLHRKIASALARSGEARSASSEIEVAFESLGDRLSVERGWLNLLRCRIAVDQIQWDEARENGESALQCFEMFQVPQGQAEALVELGFIEIHSQRASPVFAERRFKEAMALTAILADPQFAARVHGAMAHLLLYHRAGSAEAAMEHVAAIEELPEAMDNPHTRLSVLMYKAWYSLEFLTDYPLAEARFQEALAAARKVYDGSVAADAKFGLAFIPYFQGRFDEARRGLEEFLSEVRAQGRLGGVMPVTCLSAAVETPWWIALACLLLDDLEGFNGIVVAYEDPALTGGPQYPVLVRIFGAYDCLIKGDRDGFYRLFQEAIRLSEEGYAIQEAPYVYYPEFAHLFYGLGLQALGLDREAEEHIRRAKQILESSGLKGMLSLVPILERRLPPILRRLMHGS